LFDSSANIPRGGWIIVPSSKIPTGQMPHPDVFLIIRLGFIYRYLRPPMQMLFNGDGLFSVKQISKLKNSRIYGKN
jgi:hypothetical protein